MRQMIDSLAILWTEYERRLNLIDSNEYTVKGARHYVWQLNDFMAQNGYTDYSVPIKHPFFSTGKGVKPGVSRFLKSLHLHSKSTLNIAGSETSEMHSFSRLKEMLV